MASQLSPTEERIIWRASRADRAYWQLVRSFADDARRRLAIHTRRVAVAAELRGDQRARVDDSAPVDCWIPLEHAVDRELVRRRPQIRAEVAIARETRRLAVGCGYVQLSLGYVARVRRKLRRVIWRSGLSIREVASVFGIAPSTIENHLAGAKPSRTRAAWYDRLEAITVEGEYVVVALRLVPPTRKKYGWRVPLDDDADEET